MKAKPAQVFQDADPDPGRDDDRADEDFVAVRPVEHELERVARVMMMYACRVSRPPSTVSPSSYTT